MNIMTSNPIRITTRNHDRALKVPRHCVTITKKIAVTRMATMGITQRHLLRACPDSRLVGLNVGAPMTVASA